ncbi:MAG: hypothetical protein CL941_01110 [Desulfobacter sp.]|jgi:hypothetical protein|nr:hypothetical protein [Desulfobacter sp.]|tara:strand:- start:23676 stop:23897 length:222 start_codon:yes stop_codon:yes gene_type:complete
MVFPTASFLFPTFLSEQTELKKNSPITQRRKERRGFLCFPLCEKNKIEKYVDTQHENFRTENPLIFIKQRIWA